MTRPEVGEVRAREFPDADGAGTGAVFLNAASFGLLPRRTADAATALVRARASADGFDEASLGRELDRARAAAARMVGAESDEISLVPNTTYGLHLGAALVVAGARGAVVLSEGEFPANVHPWRALEERGFEVREVPTTPEGWPDEDALERSVREKDVRALAVSSVGFASGYRVDLHRLGAACRDTGTLFVVDAIQELGAGPVDVDGAGIDVLAAGGQKWLCSPWGSGFAFVRAEHRDRVRPPVLSWLAFEGSSDFASLVGPPGPLRDDGRRFEPATLGIQDYAGLARSLELFLEVGPARIRRHVQELHEPVLRWIDSASGVRAWTPREPERRAGILSFDVPRTEAVAAALREAGVIAAVREGRIRLAPHLYNTAEEMERVVEVLDRAVRG